MEPPVSWDIQAELDDLAARHLLRSLRRVESAQGPTVKIDGRELLNFSSNDYLGLANSPAMREALAEGAARFGAGSGAARLVCGSMEPHRCLEESLAQFKGTEAALAFSSGYAAALGAITALVKAGDVIILDKLCHASLIDAARLSGATLRVFPHNHLGKLADLLKSSAGTRTLVVTESIFSMDGDAAALQEIVNLKDQHGAWLMLDEAHAIGVLGPRGRGLAAALGIERRVDVHMGTLSKSVGLSGGYVAASRAVIDLLVNKARSFIYTTAPPPGIAHAACAALQIIAGHEGDALRTKLRRHVAHVKECLARLGVRGEAAILPIIVGEEAAALAMSEQLRERGVLIPAIRYPTVARGSARLRVTLSAAHEPAQVDRLLRCLAELGAVSLGDPGQASS